MKLSRLLPGLLITLLPCGCGGAAIGGTDGSTSAPEASSTSTAETPTPTSGGAADTTTPGTDTTQGADATTQGTDTTQGADATTQDNDTTQAADATTQDNDTTQTADTTRGADTSTGDASTGDASTGGGTSGGVAGDSWLIRVAAGSGFDDARGVVLAPGGALMIAGYVDGEPGESLFLGDDGDPGRIERTCNGPTAGYLSLHHGDGTIAWTELVTSDASAHTFAVTAVDQGAVVVGTFQGAAVAGAGQPGEVKLVSRGKQDIYLARYDLAGALQWATQIGGTGNELAQAVTTLADGSFAVVGYYGGTAVFGAGEAEVTLIGQELDEAFIARYTPDGTLLWVRDAGGPGNDEVLGVAATDDGGVVVTGRFQDDLVFDRKGPTELALHSAGSNDVFAARFTAAGARTWAIRAGGPDAFPAGFGDSGDQVAVLDDGGVLICGEFNGPAVVFGAGEANETILGAPADWASRKLFVARYSAATGELDWVKATATGTVDGTAGWAICDQILPRPGGEFVIVGDFYASAIFGPGEANETEVVSAGGFDVMLAAYTATGTLKWARRAGSTEDEHAGGITQLDDSVVIVGSLRGAATFALSDEFKGELDTTGLSDAFALRITP